MKYSVTTDLSTWITSATDNTALLRLKVEGQYPILFGVGGVKKEVKPQTYWEVAIRPLGITAKGIGGASSFRTFKRLNGVVDESDINGYTGEKKDFETVNVPTDATVEVYLEANKCYVVDLTGSTYFEFTPPEVPTDTRMLQQIVCQVTTGATAPTIVWKVERFFGNAGIPLIEANASYDFIYEYDFNLGKWCAGAIKKTYVSSN